MTCNRTSDKGFSVLGCVGFSWIVNSSLNESGAMFIKVINSYRLNLENWINLYYYCCRSYQALWYNNTSNI